MRAGVIHNRYQSVALKRTYCQGVVGKGIGKRVLQRLVEIELYFRDHDGWEEGSKPMRQEYQEAFLEEILFFQESHESHAFSPDEIQLRYHEVPRKVLGSGGEGGGGRPLQEHALGEGSFFVFWQRKRRGRGRGGICGGGEGSGRGRERREG